MRQLRKNQGFTVLELVVIILIVAIMASLSVLSMRGLSSTYNLKEAAGQIVSQAQLARVYAIRNRTRTVVLFTPAAGGQRGSFMIFADNPPGNWTFDSGETVITPNTVMPADVTLVNLGFTPTPGGNNYYGFDSQGIAARNAANYVTGAIQLRGRNNDTRTITFSVSGKSTVSIP
jgi:type IV fimbrial biogenesis protein FimT